MLSESEWTAKLQKSINGFALHAVRRGKGKWKKGAHIPQYVRQYFEADARGIIRDPEAVRVLTEKSGGKFKFTVTESIQETESAYSKSQAKYGAPPHLNWDDAEYLGSADDGVYYGAMKKGGTWWCLAVVDMEHYSGNIAAEGGYRSKRAARLAAEDAAYEWCRNNDVSTED